MNKILVVVPDAVMLEIVVDVLAEAFQSHVTCAATGADALDLDCIESHHVVLTQLKLPDMSGLALARQIMALRDRPVIVIAENPTVDEMVGAIRAGVADLFTTPVDVERLSDALRTGLARDATNRRQSRREARLRSVIRRVLRDRRQLNQRIELVCRDMVGAHRRLFHRVVAATPNTHPMN
ncbi:MAG: response regulator [Phycisphaerales bacterium]|nr:response regulator [Phycisphaerales bacterium]